MPRIHTSNTAILPVTTDTYNEIYAALEKAGYSHCLKQSINAGIWIDLSGIGISPKIQPTPTTPSHPFTEELSVREYDDLPPRDNDERTAQNATFGYCDGGSPKDKDGYCPRDCGECRATDAPTGYDHLGTIESPDLGRYNH